MNIACSEVQTVFFLSFLLFLATNIWPVHVLDQASFQIDASHALFDFASIPVSDWLTNEHLKTYLSRKVFNWIRSNWVDAWNMYCVLYRNFILIGWSLRRYYPIRTDFGLTRRVEEAVLSFFRIFYCFATRATQKYVFNW